MLSIGPGLASFALLYCHFHYAFWLAYIWGLTHTHTRVYPEGKG